MTGCVAKTFTKEAFLARKSVCKKLVNLSNAVRLTRRVDVQVTERCLLCTQDSGNRRDPVLRSIQSAGAGFLTRSDMHRANEL